MMISSEVAAVDANVLVYSFFPESERHSACRALLESVGDGETVLGLTSQVLAEFYAVTTDSRRVTNPRTSDETLQVMGKLLATPGIVVLPLRAEAVTRWMDLVRSYPVTRGKVFDYQLVATMLTNGVSRIYTFNTKDFARFKGIQAVTP